MDNGQLTIDNYKIEHKKYFISDNYSQLVFLSLVLLSPIVKLFMKQYTRVKF